MDIPNKYLICDIRTSKDFSSGTISGYKKRDVMNAFQNSMINGKIEEALYWCTELHISTYDKDIWKSIHDIYKKYIHINNPKLFFYILQRENEYNKILNIYPKKHYIFSRNNQEIRNLFCDLITILTLSKKNNLFLDKSLPKINIKKITKYELKHRIINQNYDIIQDLGYVNLNNTQILCINQIYHNLNNHQGTLKNCFYWYLLLEKTSKENKKNVSDFEEIIKSQTGNKNSILNYVENEKFHWTDMIFKMLDKILMNNEKNNMMIQKLIFYYKNNFKESKISNLKYIIFMIFYIIKNDISWNVPLILKYSIYVQCSANINKLYFDISEKIFNNLDNFDQDLYIQKFYETKNSMIKNSFKNIEKINEENNNINLNKIIKGNPMKIKYDKNDIEEKDKLINKNKTIKDINDAKEEKINKKLDYFNQIIVKKKPKKIIKESNNKDEIKELYIVQKRKG